MNRIVKFRCDSSLDSRLQTLQEEILKTSEEIVSTEVVNNEMFVFLQKRASQNLHEVPHSNKKILCG